MDYIREFFDEKIKSGTVRICPEYSPSKWVSGIETVDVIRVSMTCGGGVGGSQWYEYVTAIKGSPFLSVDALASACDQKYVVVELYNGYTKMLNADYIVDAQALKIASAYFNSGNWNFPMGVYKTSVLMRPDAEAVLVSK